MDLIPSAQRAVEKFSSYFRHRGSLSRHLQWGATEVKAPWFLGNEYLRIMHAEIISQFFVPPKYGEAE